ncbi:MAG: DUF488 domain-containing protein [Burkholderia sp.]|jgi:hypothetical protein
MPELFELSAYETSAEAFFETLKKHRADLVLDVRLRNTSQLCGFTKSRDLAYLVPEITGAQYASDVNFAPEPALLDLYIKKKIPWEDYRDRYLAQMKKTGAAEHFKKTYGDFRSVCLLGTATRARRSHAEALLGLLKSL